MALIQGLNPIIFNPLSGESRNCYEIYKKSFDSLSWRYRDFSGRIMAESAKSYLFQYYSFNNACYRVEYDINQIKTSYNAGIQFLADPKNCCYEIYKDRTGIYRWRYWDANLKILVDSVNPYYSAEECRGEISKIKSTNTATIVKKL